MSLDIRTFGCRLNTYESEVMRDKAGEAGLDDAILFNTCAVTGEAVRQARQAIRKARRDNPGRTIIVTGWSSIQTTTTQDFCLIVTTLSRGIKKRITNRFWYQRKLVIMSMNNNNKGR